MFHLVYQGKVRLSSGKAMNRDTRKQRWFGYVSTRNVVDCVRGTVYGALRARLFVGRMLRTPVVSLFREQSSPLLDVCISSLNCLELKDTAGLLHKVALVL
jgi:hypothetical protein